MKSAATFLLLMRHGETAWTHKGYYQGHTDIPLNARGIAEARAAARKIKPWKPDVIYASPLARAKKTAQIISKACGKSVKIDSRLREISFGQWEGKTAEELIKVGDKSYFQWLQGKWVTPKGGEPLQPFRRRIQKMLKDILREHTGKKIFLATHGGPIKAILFELLKIPFHSFWMFRAQPGSLTLIQVGSHFSQLFFLNDISHLQNNRLTG